MKAILVIEMPKKCGYECPLYNEEYDSCCYYRTPARYENCPLKPMPEKEEVNLELDYEAYYQMGWNECLEEIEK